MEGHSSKLTRAQSSLIRSPTMRSSAHNLAGLDSFESDPEEMKPHSPPQSANFAGKSPVAGIFGFCHRLAVLSALLIFFLLFSFIYLRDQSPSLWNLSLASAAVAAASVGLKRARFSLFRFRFGRSEPVRWFIGDDEADVENPNPRDDEKPVREGVEFYSNGDFYEGEFYRGKCGGSGVYNFFRQGKYEGDWVDGKYDGYGIERWARGSRYHGQYHRGLRHGFGVYKFYNGDSYAGEWVAGQSHGRGVQGCSDGSCFVGEFKCGAKHGLGYYRFSPPPDLANENSRPSFVPPEFQEFARRRSSAGVPRVHSSPSFVRWSSTNSSAMSMPRKMLIDGEQKTAAAVEMNLQKTAAAMSIPLLRPVIPSSPSPLENFMIPEIILLAKIIPLAARV